VSFLYFDFVFIEQRVSCILISINDLVSRWPSSALIVLCELLSLYGLFRNGFEIFSVLLTSKGLGPFYGVRSNTTTGNTPKHTASFRDVLAFSCSTNYGDWKNQLRQKIITENYVHPT